jgi:DNA-binding transcriptional regulator YiaG
MPAIDSNSTAHNENNTTFWENELENAKVLLFETNKGINTLIKMGHSSYSLNTGQSNQEVRRLSLAELKELRNDLMFQINELQNLLGITKRTIQIVPLF